MKIGKILKTLVGTIVLFSATTASAEEKFKCGEYSIRGVFKKDADHIVLKLYEGSLSEVTLFLPADLEEAAQIYLDRAVTLNAKMMAPVEKMQGQVQSLLSEKEIKKIQSSNEPYSTRFFREDIKERVPDPLHPEIDSGMELVKEMPCPNSNSKKAKNRKGRT